MSEQGAYRNLDNAILGPWSVLPFSSKRWNNSIVPSFEWNRKEGTQMQAAIEKVMYGYALITHLTPAEVKATRDQLAAHLAGMDADESVLAVEGMRYLRGADRVAKRRTVRKPL
jgi:hypothetical protein